MDNLKDKKIPHAMKYKMLKKKMEIIEAKKPETKAIASEIKQFYYLFPTTDPSTKSSSPSRSGIPRLITNGSEQQTKVQVKFTEKTGIRLGESASDSDVFAWSQAKNKKCRSACTTVESNKHTMPHLQVPFHIEAIGAAGECMNITPCQQTSFLQHESSESACTDRLSSSAICPQHAVHDHSQEKIDVSPLQSICPQHAENNTSQQFDCSPLQSTCAQEGDHDQQRFMHSTPKKSVGTSTTPEAVISKSFELTDSLEFKLDKQSFGSETRNQESDSRETLWEGWDDYMYYAPNESFQTSDNYVSATNKSAISNKSFVGKKISPQMLAEYNTAYREQFATRPCICSRKHNSDEKVVSFSRNNLSITCNQKQDERNYNEEETKEEDEFESGCDLPNMACSNRYPQNCENDLNKCHSDTHLVPKSHRRHQRQLINSSRASNRSNSTTTTVHKDYVCPHNQQWGLSINWDGVCIYYNAHHIAYMICGIIFTMYILPALIAAWLPNKQ